MRSARRRFFFLFHCNTIFVSRISSAVVLCFSSFWFFRRWRGVGCTGTVGRFRVLDHCDLRVLELYTGLTLEQRTAFGETGRLVGLLRQFALGVRFRVRSAVLDQFQKPVGALALHARGTAAERRQFPRVSRLDGRAFGRRETQSREIWKTYRPTNGI